MVHMDIFLEIPKAIFYLLKGDYTHTHANVHNPSVTLFYSRLPHARELLRLWYSSRIFWSRRAHYTYPKDVNKRCCFIPACAAKLANWVSNATKTCRGATLEVNPFRVHSLGFRV